MSAASLPAGRPGPLDRFLRLFTDVRPGESATALLLSVNIFVIFVAYYVLKTLRKALILTQEGPEFEAYMAAGTAVLLVGAVRFYGWFSARVPRRRLINVVTIVFVLCLVGFFGLTQAGVPVAIPFYVWLGIFNVMIVAMFWSFANDVYTTDEGERLFAIVGFGQSLGAVVGSAIAGGLIAALAPSAVFLLTAGALAGAALVTGVVAARERARTEAGLLRTTAEIPAATGEFRAASGAFERPVEAEPEPARGAAFRLVFRNRYLLGIALIVLVLNWVNSVGEYIISATVEGVATATAAAGGAAAEETIGRFYGGFYTIVNTLSLVLQLFVVSRVIKYGGPRLALAVLPVIALGGYAFMAFLPILAAIRWAKVAENATDYSLNNTARNVLFLPTTREQKYAAKQAIDSFFKVAGDVFSGVLVFVGGMLAFAPRHFAMVNLVLAAAWLGMALWVGRRYQRLAAERAA
jgi:AAA family ATP:ADP antiporter